MTRAPRFLHANAVALLAPVPARLPWREWLLAGAALALLGGLLW